MVKIAFFSNYLTHHQLPFCEEMTANSEVEFVFVANEPIEAERLAMGYKDMNTAYPFVLRPYESDEQMAKAREIADTWDIVISGSSPESFLKNRLQANKVTFHYSERIYKRGVWRVISPRGQYYMRTLHGRYRNHRSYMLCSSAYTAGDFRFVNAYPEKTFKWGYFPEVKKLDIDVLMHKKMQNTPVRILWAGRFLDWKHPELAVQLAKHLNEKNFLFQMDIIGDGDLRPELEQYVQENDLMSFVKFHGFLSPETVREYMERANIYLFTSDYNEGWGAVLNESMNSGCAVVASHAIGSVPFLLKDSVNGMIYKEGDKQSFFEKAEVLVRNLQLCERLGRAAYETIAKEWNASVAAKRLVKLCKALLDNDMILYDDGPCSPAEPIFQWNMYKYIIRSK